MRAVSIAIWTFIVVSCPFAFLGAVLVFVLTAPFDRRRLVLHLYSCVWACTYIYASPVWSLRVSGRERLPWRGPAVIVANHASLIDILVLFGLYRPFKWVSKAANFRVPFLGWNMRLNGYVPLTRGDRDSVRTMLERCRALLAERVAVLMFPEGTRSRTNELLPFKDGAFQLARETGAMVIPVAVHGTGDALPKHGFILRQRMRARVEVLAPLDPAAFGSMEELREAARTAIATALEAGRRAGARETDSGPVAALQ